MQPATLGRPTARAAFDGRAMAAPTARAGAATRAVRLEASRRLGSPDASAPPLSSRRWALDPKRSAAVRRNRRVRVAAEYGYGEAIAPDLTHTEEAFAVNLDRVAVGAYVSVSVRADVSADAGVGALVAVVHAHMPGDIYVHWGLGSEADDGGISADAWECPPAELMPPNSRRVSNWASGAAVQSQIDPQKGTVEIPLPSRPGHGLAFVLYDAEKQCYYDHLGAAFFLDSRLSADTAARATAAASAAARDQQARVRSIAEAEASESARRQAEMARARDEEARASEERDRAAAEAARRAERDELANAAAFKAAAEETARQNAADEAAAAERRRAAAEKEAAYQRQMQREAEVPREVSLVGSAYERFVNDPANPFRDFSPARAAAARGEDALPGMAATATAAAPSAAPPPGFVNPNNVDPALAAGAAAFAPSLSPGGGGGWDGASSSAATDHSYTPPPAPAPPPPAPAPVGTPGGGASGAVVASHTIPLSTESGSSTGTCEVSVMATWPPSVRIECRAGGAADGHPLLLHWGVSDRRGGTWMSPYDELQSVPVGSRAPDAQSCESALQNGVRVVEFAPVNSAATCMTMLIRTENCQEWLRETSGGDVFIDVSPALDAARAMGPPEGHAPPPQQQHHREERHHRVEERHQERHQAPASPPPPPPDTGDHMALLSNWAGANVELKDHKGGKGDRHNQWNTDGLPDAARRIVENDRDSASWRQKLQKMEEVLCGGDAGHADMDALGYSAIYLFWVGVGAVACAEDGSHYRPNHHAGSAERIYQHIEAVEAHATGSGGRHAEEVRALIRRLHPRLPAFTAEFTQSVPLTRVRDIAHGKGDRDGKCREVRAEIKHTIQNKLHRCAGPEDLVATEKMLAKLTAPGTDYPEEFVEEFRIFHRELKDFFNASTVTDRIEKLLREGDAPQSVRDAAKSFADAKARCDGIREPEGPALLAAVEEALARLSEARRAIDRELTEGGLRGANADQRQQWRLAEIGLEDYAFVLLSRGINALGAEADPPRSEMSAAEQRAALLFLAAAADAVAVSAGGGGGEFAGVAHEASELAVSGPGGMPPGGEEGALRSRAVAERARRAAEDHCAMLSDLFDGRAGALGRALGIDQHVVEVFTEGQIRASVVFQSAKLASHLLRAARAATGEAGWDCIVPGEVKGARLVCVDRLLPTDPTIASLSASDPAIVCVASADGDEEVTTCGPGVVGILLCHALPHLSHLALRARQAQTPLVAIEDPNLAAKARALADAPGVHLKAAPSAISLDACEGGYVGGGGGGGGGALSSRVAAALVADTSAAGQVIDLRDLGAAEWSRAVAVAGSKATACASLSALAAESGAFAAPAGAVLPFGSFELAATQAGADGRLAFLLDALESVAGDATQTAQICDELQSLARATRPSSEALEQLSALFPRGSRIMVRSTGNAEDLAGLSAAGLYDSVSNVDPHDFETLGGAVAEVWASLFTTRAVGSRAAAGVGQRDAAMAVLAQQMLVPEVSFILMTKHPMTGDANVAYAELALGHGETLASGAVRGTPWRLSMNRAVPGEARLDAVSSFGAALVPSASGNGELVSEPVNCGAHWMTVDEHRRATLSARLVTAGDLIERRLLGADGRAVPQDIEGCVTADGEVWIVQARPQP